MLQSSSSSTRPSAVTSEAAPPDPPVPAAAPDPPAPRLGPVSLQKPCKHSNSASSELQSAFVVQRRSHMASGGVGQALSLGRVAFVTHSAPAPRPLQAVSSLQVLLQTPHKQLSEPHSPSLL